MKLVKGVVGLIVLIWLAVHFASKPTDTAGTAATINNTYVRSLGLCAHIARSIDACLGGCSSRASDKFQHGGVRSVLLLACLRLRRAGFIDIIFMACYP